MKKLSSYIVKRKKRDKEFREGFDQGYRDFKIGVMLKNAREKKGMTQEELAKKLNTKKTAISRIENHAEDIRLSTIEKIASALDVKLKIIIG